MRSNNKVRDSVSKGRYRCEIWRKVFYFPWKPSSLTKFISKCCTQQPPKASKETASNSVFTFFLMSLTSWLLMLFSPLWNRRKLVWGQVNHMNDWAQSSEGSVLLFLIHQNVFQFHMFLLTKISMKNVTLFPVQCALDPSSTVGPFNNFWSTFQVLL
jgi:hypothetical protein